MKDKVFNPQTGKSSTYDIKGITFHLLDKNAHGYIIVNGKRISVSYSDATKRWSRA